MTDELCRAHNYAYLVPGQACFHSLPMTNTWGALASKALALPATTFFCWPNRNLKKYFSRKRPHDWLSESENVKRIEIEKTFFTWKLSCRMEDDWHECWKHKRTQWHQYFMKQYLIKIHQLHGHSLLAASNIIHTDSHSWTYLCVAHCHFIWESEPPPNISTWPIYSLRLLMPLPYPTLQWTLKFVGRGAAKLSKRR